ncbi:MAG TPA: FeoB-associated Cys-rich membrane protein [Clostridia bacterium]|nr:FeoB-associated Cys-rich membrane protein [Clostridia bacterium]
MLGNVIAFLVIAALISGAVAKIIIDKRNGIRCTGCSCGSENCPSKSSCCE